ncbi:NAD(P)-dependent oxidoreductase [Paludibaculum fermentans]|uniref:NAD(P)-dependent oxidoreductase n=1 Tax=Paludibaculum fermentans TaxID=1473598 RepID=A0A7S7SHH6_PALFE|nr:NAD(P)-dependent oxidoreductase [Paludibaculum fermentans]QOY85927.1 NAD(P)-dependent oxidoreductase [Paludibaculum fermentans]
MAKLGFLGLGIMGGPMAGHLLKAGHEVALWSHTASKATALAGLGQALVCEMPKQVAENADIIFLCVGDTDMSAKVTLGENGLIEGLRPGAVIADCSTVAPSYARRAAATLAEKGAEFLDAPVTGSKPGAEGATLTFMVGGNEAVYEKVKPFMELMGKRFYYCGGTGLGLHAKLTQNLILSNLLQAFNEGMVLATKAGVDPELMLDILDNSAAKSGLVSFKAPYVFRRDFSTNFSVRWMHKDIGLMLETGNEMDVPLPLTALTQQLFRAAIAEGVGEDDICSTIKVLERLAGVEVKKSSQK